MGLRKVLFKRTNILFTFFAIAIGSDAAKGEMGVKTIPNCFYHSAAAAAAGGKNRRRWCDQCQRLIYSKQQTTKIQSVTDTHNISLSHSLSISFSLSLSLFLSLSPSLLLSLSLSFSLSLYLSLSLSFFISFSLSFFLPLHLCLSLSFFLSLSLPYSLSTFLSPSVFLSKCQYKYLEVIFLYQFTNMSLFIMIIRINVRLFNCLIPFALCYLWSVWAEGYIIFQYLFICSILAYKIYQSSFKILSYTKYTLKILPKGQNFDRPVLVTLLVVQAGFA